MDRESYLELESILRDIKAERAKPHHLPFEFFKYITDNFSPDLEVGRGGFGVVYKGVLKYGEIVVVKRLRAAPGTLDKQYENEANLLSLKHENIVRILGYCSETRQELIQHEGKCCSAYILERLICLEYMPNGSLDRYIKDASSGLIWNQRFEIIKGICYGLHFLHEEYQINNPVIHLDLTPANILLTNGMVPKITDFGLSRLFGGQQTRIYTTHNIGKRGYMAPEFLLRGKITKKSDIFSLGVIILEMITGNKDYPWSNDTTTVQNYVKIEVQKWRERMMEDLNSTFVETNCRHIKKCIEIGLKCVDTDEMTRPTTKEIIESLNRLLDSSNATSSKVVAKRKNVLSVGHIPALEIPAQGMLGHGLNESSFAIANVGPRPSFQAVHINQGEFEKALKFGGKLGFQAVHVDQGCSVELQDKQQSSTELQDKQQSDFGVDNIANNMSSCALLSNKEVIDVEDDLLVADAANTSKVKTEMVYPSMENMMSTPMNTNILQGDQDGYSIAIPDYLGSDMSCYQPIQTDLQPGMSLNDSASITVMEDSIYGSLGDIGFMEVWD